jgi:hypothetical protein
MKAYRVWNIHEEWQEIVYDYTAYTAKYRTADMYCPPDIDKLTYRKDLRARHFPKMDKPGYQGRGYVEWDRDAQRFSGIYRCEHCGSKNADGDLMCADCERMQHESH